MSGDCTLGMSADYYKDMSGDCTQDMSGDCTQDKSGDCTQETLKVVGVKGEGAGRQVVSRRDLRAGELVLSEAALVSGPRLSPTLVCVSCLSRLASLLTCPACGLPLCSPCQRGNSQHHPECQIFINNNFYFSFKSPSEAKIVSPLVTIIRLLLSENWRHLESNLEKRLGSNSWNHVEKHIVPILTSFKDFNGNNIFTKDNVQLAAGVLDTNSFEIKTKDKFGRSLFLNAAMLNNNCSPNCVRRVTEGRIDIISVREVGAGEELSICYTDVLLPASIRQEIFLTSKHFSCLCSRCRNPPDSDKIRCDSCGNLVSLLQCLGCGKHFPLEDQERLVEECQQLVSGTRWECLPGVSPGVTSVMSRLESLLDGEHRLVVQLRARILQHGARCDACSDAPHTITARLQAGRTRQRILCSPLDLLTLSQYK